MTESDFETLYPHLREVLDDRFASLSDDELEALFESAFGEGITPAEYEEFFGSIGRAARDVGRFVQKAAPTIAGVAKGALSGAAAGSVGGPFGAIGGALIGGASSALSRHGTGSVRDVGRALGGVVTTAGLLTGRGALMPGAPGLMQGLVGRGANPATNALHAVLRQPETLRALSALFSGRNPTIAVGRSRIPVPAHAFAGLLGALAREAEAEAWVGDDTETVPGYLVDSAGQLVVDPSDPELRAARLLQLLAGGAEHLPQFIDNHTVEYDDSEYDESSDGEYDDVWVDADDYEPYALSGA